MDNSWDAELEGILKDLTERKKRSKEKDSKDRMVAELKKMIVAIEKGIHTGNDLIINYHSAYTEFKIRVPVYAYKGAFNG